MKKIFIYTFSIFMLILNIYLVFVWNPSNMVTSKEYGSKETISYSKSIYKVDKNTALAQLSSEDKRELEKIIKKLSAYDMGKIKQYYEETNEEEGVVNAFKLLKRRLSSEDYKRIEEISSTLIEIDQINKKIKK